jgi:two-component sensor histidine kinase/DNA-binding response OmpR family regulator/ligand-binding sensor protein
MDAKGKRILLVEDDAILGMVTSQQLKEAGYDVTCASSGVRAVELARAKVNAVDLVLMDIDLGRGMDGTEAAREILRTQDVPVLFLSSHTEQEIVSKTEEITNYGYVVKNSSFTVLDASIKMAFKLFDAHASIRLQKMEIEAGYEEMQVTNQNLMESEALLMRSEAAVRSKLGAILDPQGDIGVLELSDIIDARAIQSLMEDFHALTGMLGAILDIKGRVLVAVGWQDICTKFHRCNPESAANCRESDTILTEGVPDGTFRKYRCKNQMWDMVTPLLIDGRHIGNIFIGQFFLDDEELDTELFRRQARKYGFDEEEYLQALARVPRLSRETVNKGMAFYAKIAKMISSLSYSSIKLSRALAEGKFAEQKIARLLVEKDLILKEAHHRIKNNMAMVHGLLALQAGDVADAKAKGILGDAASRVQSMMVLYEKLYLSDFKKPVSLADYLPALIAEIIAVYPHRENVRVHTEVEDLPLEAKQLSTLGIIVNELATNSMKYAFVGRSEGTIRLLAARMGARLRIEYSDDGVGIADAGILENSSGFGIKLITTLVEQLHGTISFDGSDGSAFSIDFAL